MKKDQIKFNEALSNLTPPKLVAPIQPDYSKYTIKIEGLNEVTQTLFNEFNISKENLEKLEKFDVFRFLKTGNELVPLVHLQRFKIL